MTQPDYGDFAKLFGAVLVAASREFDQVQLDVYFAALAVYDVKDLERALPAALRRSRGMVSVGIWAEEAQRMRDGVFELTAPPRPALEGIVSDPSYHECPRCDDTGWAPTVSASGVRRVSRCPCVRTNATIKAKLLLEKQGKRQLL